VDLVLFEEIKEVGMMPPSDAEKRGLKGDAWGYGSSGSGGIVGVGGRFVHCSFVGMGGSISVAGIHGGWVGDRGWCWLLRGGSWTVTLTLV